MRKELIVLGIVVLVIAGYFLFSGVKDVVINTPAPTPDPYAGWNTYTNEEYGFSFRYPNELWSGTDLELDAGLTKLLLDNNSNSIEFIIHIEPFFDNMVGCGSSVALKFAWRLVPASLF